MGAPYPDSIDCALYPNGFDFDSQFSPGQDIFQTIPTLAESTYTLQFDVAGCVAPFQLTFQWGDQVAANLTDLTQCSSPVASFVFPHLSSGGGGTNLTLFGYNVPNDTYVFDVALYNEERASQPQRLFPSPSPTPAPHKNAIVCLTAMGLTDFHFTHTLPNNSMAELWVHPQVYSGAVINVEWAQLEPQPGVLNLGAVDEPLDVIAAYNATPVAAKLRVYSGGGTPAWVYAIAGGPITCIDAHYGPFNTSAWWTPQWRTLWRPWPAATTPGCPTYRRWQSPHAAPTLTSRLRYHSTMSLTPTRWPMGSTTQST